MWQYIFVCIWKRCLKIINTNTLRGKNKWCIKAPLSLAASLPHGSRHIFFYGILLYPCYFKDYFISKTPKSLGRGYPKYDISHKYFGIYHRYFCTTKNVSRWTVDVGGRREQLGHVGHLLRPLLQPTASWRWGRVRFDRRFRC